MSSPTAFRRRKGNQCLVPLFLFALAFPIPAPAQTQIWARLQGAPASHDSTTAVATDESGAVYTAGDFGGTTSIGGTTIASKGNKDVIVSKLGPDGTYQWAMGFGGVGVETANGIAAGGGKAIVVGSFSSTVVIGNSQLVSAGGSDVFIVILNAADGSVSQVSTLGSDTNDIARGVLLNGGTIYTAGGFQRTATFWPILPGNTVSLTSAGSYDVFLLAQSTNGTPLWGRRYGGANADLVSSISGNGSRVVLAGGFDSLTDLGAGPLSSSGAYDGFVASYGIDGSPVWSKAIGGASFDNANDVAVEPSGTIDLTGYTNGTVNFGGGAVNGFGGNDVFIAKYASDGSYLAAKIYGTSGSEDGVSVAADSSGNAIIAGTFLGTFNLGSGSIVSGGAIDGFLAGYSASLGPLFSKAYGGVVTDKAVSVTVDNQDKVLLTGFTGWKIDFGGGELTTDGYSDGFVAKLNKPGVVPVATSTPTSTATSTATPPFTSTATATRTPSQTLTSTPTNLANTPTRTNTASAQPTICSCPGDANADGFVNLNDFGAVQENFGRPCPTVSH